MKHLSSSWILALVVAAAVVRYAFHTPQCSLSENMASRVKIVPQSYLLTHSMPSSLQKLAYVQYATDMDYLRLAVHNFMDLRDTNAIGDFVVLYDGQLRHQSEFEWVKSTSEKIGIILQEVDVISGTKGTWRDSFTKLHVFGLDYDRVVYFDSDTMLVGYTGGENRPRNLDELFSVPEDIDIAMPQAYWLSKPVRQRHGYRDAAGGELPSLYCDEHKHNHRDSFFASHVIVLKPSKAIYEEILQYVHNPWWWHLWFPQKVLGRADYDMEVTNKYVDDQIRARTGLKFGVLDHRVYGVLTGEFKEEQHWKFLAEPQDLPFVDGSGYTWDAIEVVKNAKLVHFSDAPIPKPWKPEDPTAHYNSFKIYCGHNVDEEALHRQFPEVKPRLVDDCDSVEVWNWIMREFRRSRGLEP